MRVLVVTNMYPYEAKPWSGVFVRDQVESLRKNGIEVDVLLAEGPKNRLNYPLGILRLWKALREKSYDLIHAHYVYSGLVARAQWRRPVVLTHHGLEVFHTPRQATLCRLTTPWFDEVIVTSQQMKDRLGRAGVHVIPCGVDMDRFQPEPRDASRAALGFSPDTKLVLWAGDPRRPEKRFDLVEAAMDLLRQRDPAVELILLAGRAHDQVPRYMNAADVLLLTSAAEGSPMVVKEAMACNLPVVSVPVGDAPQVIGDTEGCYLCTHDPSDIAEKTLMALAGRQRTRGREAVQHLALDVIAQQVAQVYQRAIEGSRSAPDSKSSPVASRRQ